MCDSLKKLGYTALSLAPVAMFAEGSATLPDVGQGDLSSYVTLGITAIAGVVAVVIGGYVAFKVVKKALAWVAKAF